MFLGKFANILPLANKADKLHRNGHQPAVRADDCSPASLKSSQSDNPSGHQPSAKADEYSPALLKSSQSGHQPGEDKCSPASLKRHQIGDNLRIKVNLLIAPGASREVRPLDLDHVEKLQRDMQKNPDCNFTKLLLHVRKDPHEVNSQKLNSGEYMYEVLGGNHTRYALQRLGRDVFVDAAVYAGLSDGQALCLALQHNLQHKNAKPMTFTNYVLKFREHWERVTNNLEAPTRDERSNFKDYLSKILRVSRQTVNNSYRHHIFMVTSVPDLWAKLQQLLLMWEKGEILEQLPRPFNQCDAIVLERCDDLGQCLLQLCQKDMSWKQLRTSKPSKANKAPKNQGESTSNVKVATLEEQVRVLKERNQGLMKEVRSLKRENQEKNEEVRVLRRKLEVTKAIKEIGSRKDEGSQKVEEDSFKEGEWIGVVFNTNCYIGQVMGMMEDGSVRTQFLTGRLQGRLSKRDVQCVHREFIITKVDGVASKNGVYALEDNEAVKLSKSFELYKKKCM